MSKFMKAAIVQAKKAYALGEVPIGCVIVKDNQIIARGYDRRSIDHNTLAHAEMIAIKKACKKLGDWRLEDCTVYITLEPCPMCAGAIVQARIKNIVIGAMNAKAGCAGSILDLMHIQRFNHQVDTLLLDGEIHEECVELLKDFFRELRQKKSLT